MNTPRTSAATLTEPYQVRELPFEVVRASDMEQLETELAEVTKERDTLKDELQHYIDEGLIIKEDEDGL